MTLESINSNSGLSVSNIIAMVDGSVSASSRSSAAKTSPSRLTPQFLHQSLITPDILNGHVGIRELASQIIFRSKRRKEGIKGVRERASRVEERLDGIPEGLAVFKDLFGPRLDGGEFPVEVVEFWIAGL